jgi:elongation factor Ts
MAVTALEVKALRDQTGAGFMECKAALTETQGDLDEAVTLLRKRGLARAAKRAGRSTSEGLIGSYIHMGGKIGVLIELNCESDFVARTDEFQALLKDLSMHIAAASPLYASQEDVAVEAVEREKEIYRSQLSDSNKPDHLIKKIVEGKLEAYYEQVVLVDQPFIKDRKITVGQLIATTIAKLGENITVSRFSRFKVGETP